MEMRSGNCTTESKRGQKGMPIQIAIDRGITKSRQAYILDAVRKALEVDDIPMIEDCPPGLHFRKSKVLPYNCARPTTNHIGMRKEDVRFIDGILFIVGALCCARYLVQDFFVVRFVR